MRVTRTVAYWLFLCCLPVLIVTSNIRWGVTEARLYEYGFNKYQISQVTGIAESELDTVAQHLIDYFDSKVDSAQVMVSKAEEEFSLFNKRELVHLQDVKHLIQFDYMVQRIALILMVVCGFVLLLGRKDKWRILCKGVFWGSLATLVLVVILILWAIFGFEQLFLLFHQLSFSNEFWILNPTSDYLIMLFPEPFFFDVALFGLGAVILESLLLGGITFSVLKSRGWNQE